MTERSRAKAEGKRQKAEDKDNKDKGHKAKADVNSKNVTTQEMQHDVTSIFKKFDLPKTNS